MLIAISSRLSGLLQGGRANAIEAARFALSVVKVFPSDMLPAIRYAALCRNLGLVEHWLRQSVCFQTCRLR